MKNKYERPVAEKIEFDYTQVVVASKGGNHGDMGVGGSQTDKGCDREPGHNEGWNHGQGCF